MTISAFVSTATSLPIRKQYASPTTTIQRIVPPTACTPSVSRRTALFTFAASALTLVYNKNETDAAVTPTSTANEKLLGESIENENYGFAFRAPASGWTKNLTTISSARSAVVFLRDADNDSNISMISTPVSGDYTKLASFGSMDNVVKTLVPGKKGDIEGELISSESDSEKNAYLIEYTITSKGVKRHLLTVFSLQPGRYINTLTGQAVEDSWKDVEPVIRAVTNSFHFKQVK